MGSPAFAVPVLGALAKAGHHVAVVYSQPPKPAGRGHQVQKSPVHVAAEILGIEVRTPKTLRDSVEQQRFSEDRLDAAVVVAYGLILPKPILEAPRLGCLNIHFSLLPRWRGAAPVPRAMLAGDTETGICIMQMDAGLDTGDVLAREAMPIGSMDTASNLLNKLTTRGAHLALQTLEGRQNGTLMPVKQPAEGATYAAKLTREDGRVDWAQPAVFIERQIRALQPWPGCYFMFGEEPIKLLKAEIVAGKNGAPGTLLADDCTVACGADALRLVELQRPGKKPTDGASFLRGVRLSVGQSL
jgi:methionyl-tRNA formyltransferase